jgi:hypothetical protein
MYDPAKIEAVIDVPIGTDYSDRLSKAGIQNASTFVSYFNYSPVTGNFIEDPPYTSSDLIAENNRVAIEQAAVEKIVGPLTPSGRNLELAKPSAEASDMLALFNKNAWNECAMGPPTSLSNCYIFVVRIVYSSICGRLPLKLIDIRFHKVFFDFIPTTVEEYDQEAKKQTVKHFNKKLDLSVKE